MTTVFSERDVSKFNRRGNKESKKKENVQLIMFFLVDKITFLFFFNLTLNNVMRHQISLFNFYYKV